MKKSKILAGSIVLALSAVGTNLQAGQCDLKGSYGYVYKGYSYDSAGPVEIAETGAFSVDTKSLAITGTAKATFRFEQFGNIGPLWALVQLDFSSLPGGIEVGADPCQGVVNFLATGTVLNSSPVNLAGLTLFVDQERSIAYTVSGLDPQFVDLISTSPGSVIAGTAKAQLR